MTVAQHDTPLVLQPLTLAEADAETEEWRPAWGEGDLVYEVSNHGRVRSVKILGLVRDRDRPLRVNFYQGNRAVSHYVHDLVAAAFLGKRPDQSVGFRDGDQRNPRPENLVLRDERPRPRPAAERPPRRTAETAGWLSVSEAAALLGVSDSRVRQLVQLSRLTTAPGGGRVLIDPTSVQAFLAQRRDRDSGVAGRPVPLARQPSPPAATKPGTRAPAAPLTASEGPPPAPRPPVEPAGPPPLTPPALVPPVPRATHRPLACVALDGYALDDLDQGTLLRDPAGREGWGGHRWYIPGREEADPRDPASRDHVCARCAARKPPPEPPPLNGDWRKGGNSTIRGLGEREPTLGIRGA